ncbi:unnamed protein product [Coffea canephora]|uniref:Uncharacterized protein n=1 Tax=Coffea canephora TaxID=49390 RepID=A0A068V3Q2_COFCA|nr:unnamed protein product [Coffea canephora]
MFQDFQPRALEQLKVQKFNTTQNLNLDDKLQPQKAKCSCDLPKQHSMRTQMPLLTCMLTRPSKTSST